jgi:ABC-type antimicrobial peptide transport system permease subunit
VLAAATVLNEFVPGNTWITSVNIEGRPTPDGKPWTVVLRRITPDYFRTMGIGTILGRTFDERDRAGGVDAVVVSRNFAERIFPGEEPLGGRIERTGRYWTIVGVVEDVADVDLLDPPEPTIYINWSQSSSANSPVGLIIRTAGDPSSLAPALRRVIHDVDPALPLNRVQPLERFIADSLAPQRFRTALLAWLAVVGLILGGVGVAGLTAQTLGERMTELSVRLALGCERTTLWRSAVARQLRRVLAGCFIGFLLALATGRLVAALLPEVNTFDSTVVLVATITLVTMAALAAAVPASRVLRIEVRSVLR